MVSDADLVEVEIGSRRNKEEEEAIVTFDGTDIMRLRTGERVVIQKAQEVTKLIKLSKLSFVEDTEGKNERKLAE